MVGLFVHGGGNDPVTSGLVWASDFPPAVAAGQLSFPQTLHLLEKMPFLTTEQRRLIEVRTHTTPATPTLVHRSSSGMSMYGARATMLELVALIIGHAQGGNLLRLPIATTMDLDQKSHPTDIPSGRCRGRGRR